MVCLSHNMGWLDCVREIRRGEMLRKHCQNFIETLRLAEKKNIQSRDKFDS